MHILLDMHMHAMHYRGMTLAEYLSSKRLTDEAFASIVNLSQSQISRIKRGISRPSWSAVEAIERATGGEVSASDFLPRSKQGERA